MEAVLDTAEALPKPRQGTRGGARRLKEQRSQSSSLGTTGEMRAGWWTLTAAHESTLTTWTD